MRQTRAQLLWKFQIYLDEMKIMDDERRDRLSTMFLERQLSRSTEREFLSWLKTNQRTQHVTMMRKRGSRLVFFFAWLNCFRPFADREERERLTRLYYSHNLSRNIEREFHRYLRERNT